jgi:hypothetical protein
MTTTTVWPDCTCGHPSDEHTYDPSGCAGTACWHAESYDSDGWPKDGKCTCTDYNPARCPTCGREPGKGRAWRLYVFPGSFMPCSDPWHSDNEQGKK